MTFSGDPVKTGNTVLKAVVVLAIFFAAYWAVRGGYDEVVTPVTTTTSTTSTTTTSTTTTSTTTTSTTTTTTIPDEGDGNGEEGEDG